MRKLRSGIAALATAAVMILAMLMAGCAGREPNPVARYQYGDEKKPCGHLRAEISELQAEMQRKAKKCESTEGKNVALGVTGKILFGPPSAENRHAQRRGRS